MGLLVENKDVVVPGEELADGIDFLPAQGTYRDGDKIIASQIGLVSIEKRLIKLIPLRGRYIPKKNDVVMGKITNIGFSNWLIDIGYAYEAILSLKDATSEFIERGEDLTRYYNIDDIIIAKIVNVNKTKAVDLSMIGPELKKLKNGKVIEVTPSKVPRIIGKQGSMISIVKEATNCKIIIGQNGRVWIQGNPEMEIIAENAIKMIDEKAHIDGLTDKVKEFLDKAVKK